MKLASKSLCIIVAASAAVFAGCAKKPVRPEPNETALGPGTGNAGALTPSEVQTAPDTTLQARDSNIIEDANTIRGLLQPVYFDFARSNVKTAARATLQRQDLGANPAARTAV